MKKVAIYSRKSKFTGKGDSIENQIEMCKSFATKQLGDDIEFIVYEDEGFSGGNIDRPQFKKLMRDAKTKKFDVLVCYRLDRISRNVADFSVLVEKLQSLKIDFISIKEQFDTSTPMGRAMMYIASVFAQLERETIAERVKDNMLELAKNGRWTGGRVPLGFDSKRIEYIDNKGSKREKSLLVINEKEIDFVKFLYEKYLELGSLHQLEAYIHENNIRSKNDILYEKSTLRIILKNPVYVKSSKEVVDYLLQNNWEVYGEPDGVHSLLTYNKTENITKDGKNVKTLKSIDERFAAVSRIEGALEPELWLKVQRQFDKNRNTFPRLGKTHNVLLTGKVRCGHCDNYMAVRHGRVSKITGEKTFHYICSIKIKSRKKLCDNNNANASELDKLVIASLKKLAEEKNEYLSKLKSKNTKTLIDNESGLEKITIENSLKEKKQQIDNLVNKLSIDTSIDEILMDKIKMLKEECNNLNKRLENIDNKIEDIEMEQLDISFVSSILDRCALIDKLSREEQKQIINALINTIYWYGDEKKIRIKFIGTGTDPDDDGDNYFSTKEYTIGELDQLDSELFFCSQRMCSIQ